MGIPYWDPLAGYYQAKVMHAQKVAAARRGHEAELQARAFAASRAKHPAPRNLDQPRKCPGCGSHTYALTLRGRVCSYCRTPEGDGA